MIRTYHAWHSAHLNRQMELLVFGHAGARVLVFPTRFGRFYDYEDFGIVGALAEKIENGWIQLFCVDSVDGESVYSDRPPYERIQRHSQYEKYILDEVLPLTRQLNPQPFMIAHGCSLGAYHAMNLALRHPQHFGKVVALSGRYNLSEPVAVFRGLFDDYYNEEIYFHSPNHFLPNLNADEILDELRRLEIVLVIGREDPFLESNLSLSKAMDDKRIAHQFHVWEGRAHKARYWRQMVGLYL
ncbi:esterase family protein [Spirosoma daeguense]